VLEAGGVAKLSGVGTHRNDRTEDDRFAHRCANDFRIRRRDESNPDRGRMPGREDRS
jgi:hypothetical protein